MSLVKHWRTGPCALAFSDDGGFLAAGMSSITRSSDPALRILSTRDDGFLGAQAAYVSPAGFERLAWSASGGLCGGGLIAGGLNNGAVSVWDTRTFHYCKDSLEIHEKPVTSTILLDSKCGNLTKAFGDESLIGSNAEPSRKLFTYRADCLRPDASEGLLIIDNYFAASPPRDQDSTADSEEVIDNFNGVESMVAMFSKYTGPVRGLCFSPHSSNYLASGGPEGKVFLWDLAEAYIDIIPTTEHIVSKDDISFLVWSPSMENALLATSHTGEAVVMDLRAKSAIMSKSHANAELSCCQWVPSDPNLILTANRSNATPFTVWDIRKMKEPVKRFGKEISGANCVSFCPVDIDLILATTDDGIFTLNIKADEIKRHQRWGKSCGDVHFKGKSGEMFAAATEDGIDMYRSDIINNRDEDCLDFIEYC